MTDALHNLLRLVEREHQRIADLELKNAELEARVEQYQSEVLGLITKLAALVDREQDIARVQRGRIDSLQMRVQ